ncbi:trans-sialidase [Trypanosoma cruzi]|nr:trans-sialidase [Trypanosoma cruzi]
MTWGQCGRRPLGHSQACGSIHNWESFGKTICLWKPLSPRTLREGRWCCTLGKGTPWGRKRENVFHLWVTDNNRTFSVGPVAMEDNLELFHALLHSDGALHILQDGIIKASNNISLVPLTEGLQMFNYVLKSWAQLDSSSELFTPTAGLVGFIFNASSDGDTWIDDYLCVNAIVTKNAMKAKDGFKFTGPGSGAVWPVSSREHNGPHTFVSCDFTIVATVMIQILSKLGTPLPGAGLDAPVSTSFIGLSHDADGRWETVFYGIKTASGSTWEPGKKYQVVLMLPDGHRGCVYVNGVIVGSPEKIRTPETRGLKSHSSTLGATRETSTAAM